MPLFHLHFKPWGYEEIKNSDEKVNIRAFRDEKQKKKLKKAKAVFSGGGITHLYAMIMMI